MERARESWAGETRPVGLRAKLRLMPGEAAQLEVTRGERTVRATGAEVQMARSRPLDVQRVEAQLRKTGGTAYEFEEIEIEATGNAFIAVSELNALRREALDAMTRALCGFAREPDKMPGAALPPSARQKPLLRAQSGSVAALRKARELGADELVFAPEDMRVLDDALELDAFYLALPQVARGEELEKLNRWALAHARNILGVYITNIAHLALNWPGRRIADYPMNIANGLAARETGAEEYSPSVELTARQIAELGGEKDIIVHGDLPLMQLRHCPRRAAHDMPGPHSQCHLCDARSGGLTWLEDRTGARFPLKRMAYDTGCVIQLMNSVPLMLLRRLDRLPGAKAWRLLIGDDTADVTALYRAHLDGGDFTRLPQWRRYEEIKTTTGHYFRGVE